jgi:hypothetical protein
MGRIVTGVARADLSGRDYTPSAKVNAGFMEAPDLRVEGKKVPSPSQLLINELMKSTDMEIRVAISFLKTRAACFRMEVAERAGHDRPWVLALLAGRATDLPEPETEVRMYDAAKVRERGKP